jgi:hypothetical protein
MQYFWKEGKRKWKGRKGKGQKWQKAQPGTHFDAVAHKMGKGEGNFADKNIN